MNSSPKKRSRKGEDIGKKRRLKIYSIVKDFTPKKIIEGYEPLNGKYFRAGEEYRWPNLNGITRHYQSSEFIIKTGIETEYIPWEQKSPSK